MDYSIIISIASFVISIITFIYNWYCNKLNLKIKIINCREIVDIAEMHLLIIDCYICNVSKNFVSIDNISFKNAKEYNAIRNDILLGGYSTKIFGQECSVEAKTSNLPVKLSSYDSINAKFIIPITDNIKLKQNVKILFKTSRGLVVRNNSINKN